MFCRIEPAEKRWLLCVPIFFCIFLQTGCLDGPRSSGWLGINTCLGEEELEGGVNHGLKDSHIRITYDLVGELGVPLVRDSLMNWSRIQPTRDGVYDFAWSDAIVRQANKRRVDILALFDRIPPWAFVGMDVQAVRTRMPARADADAFAVFVKRFVERYDGDGIGDMPGLRQSIGGYEFINGIEDVRVEEYVWWLKLFYQTVKSADAKATVVLGSFTSPGLRRIDFGEGDYHTYFERLLSNPALQGADYPYFDVVGFHNYPDYYPGRSPFADSLAYLGQTMARHELNLPIWLTEYGSDKGDSNELRQANDIVRWAIEARSLGIERVYLHGLWDINRGGLESDRSGLVVRRRVGEVLHKKLGFGAFAMLLNELADKPQLIRRGEGVYRLAGGNDSCLVVWKEELYDPSAILVPGWWEVRTLTGRKYTRQGSALKLTKMPLFLRKVRSPFIE
ncbi:MAG: hypothetical protein JSV03_00505 [Planctomycetota bacterium]|nr:MAG: hypothetical protein JSV03_00505 [Planctomycetota bacterium]